MDINMNSIMGVPYQTTYWNEIGTNPVVLLVVTVIIIAYYALFATLGVAKGQSASDAAMQAGKGIVFMEVLLWGVFVLLVLINGMTYIFNIDITASIRNLFSATPEIDIIVDPDDLAGDSTNMPSTVPEIKLAKQVFHVPGNKYGYEDSKAICKAYGGRLATWKEMDQAFNKGADWCSFGWSDGQMALYPTQYEKWARLQKIKGHEHDCGRPGINGGYIANPNVRFGVNCYGYRPRITQEEAEAMKLAPLYPRTRRERAFDKRVDYWRDNLSEIQVAPFNHDNWSVI
jgi:TM2 domain-containing membrane protein YozV